MRCMYWNEWALGIGNMEAAGTGVAAGACRVALGDGLRRQRCGPVFAGGDHRGDTNPQRSSDAKTAQDGDPDAGALANAAKGVCGEP